MTVVGDGLQTRDFAHVSDVVEANLLAADINNENIVGEIFNIGYGERFSIMDLVKMVGGEEAEFVRIPPRPGEARHTLSDCTKAQKLLKWKTKQKTYWIGNTQLNLKIGLHHASNNWYSRKRIRRKCGG
jgi:UDP-glucose 4-epimerase